jgi:hypothetical protein
VTAALTGRYDVTFRTLRHTFASILIAQGRDAAIVADQLGHEDRHRVEALRARHAADDPAIHVTVGPADDPDALRLGALRCGRRAHAPVGRLGARDRGGALTR